MFSGSRLWVYPRASSGSYHRIHKITTAIQHLVLFGVPWLTWNDYPLLRIDVPARRVYAMGQIFTASDGALIMIGGLLAAFALFFFTSLWGRLWCGYACPHSVFLLNWVMPIERWIEGSMLKRKRLDRRGWDFDKIWRKAAKWALFAVVSVGLSMAFMGFFADPSLLWTGQAGSGNYAVVAAFSVMWFWDFAWFREQLCNYLCPYARFQSALMDDESLVISFDPKMINIPKGGSNAVDEGRCLDCKACVHVCPQGIDIRDGFQLECIACGRCIDACTNVLANVGRPSLISYTTVAEAEGRGGQRWVTPRTVLYATLLTGLTAAGIFLLATRVPFEVHVNRAPGTLFIADDDGFIRNTFLVQVTNRDAQNSHTYSVAIEGMDHAEVSAAPLTLEPSESRMVPLIVRLPRAEVIDRTQHIKVRIDDGEDTLFQDATFKTPGPQRTN